MKNTVKEKVTVSIDPKLIRAVDAAVKARRAASRSAVVEEALRMWQLEQRRKSIEKQTEAYYQSRSKAEVKEDLEWGRLAAQQFKYLWND